MTLCFVSNCLYPLILIKQMKKKKYSKVHSWPFFVIPLTVKQSKKANKRWWKHNLQLAKIITVKTRGGKKGRTEMTLSVLVCFKAGNSRAEALVPRQDSDKTALQLKLNVKIQKHVNKRDVGEHLNVFRRFFHCTGTSQKVHSVLLTLIVQLFWKKNTGAICPLALTSN